MTELEEYYNKFNEDKRLKSRHGQVEFITTMKYIHRCLEAHVSPSILDIGAGTGAYSIPLADEGYDVTAVELVKHNLGILKQKSDKVKAYQGNALKLKRFPDESFDVVLLFGPMYHLSDREDKVRALSEAARVCKKNGHILVAYFMNDYCVIRYAFMEGHIGEILDEGGFEEDYHIKKGANPLYSQVRTEDIDSINSEVDGVVREKIISADGAANYIRRSVNALDERGFEEFIKYHLSICERADMLGASAHVVDILRKTGNESDDMIR